MKNKTTDYSDKAQTQELAIGNMEVNKTGRNFFKWVQEFSKKIVTITFVIFVLINLFTLGLVAFNYFTTYDLVYLDILLSETHLTFREVIGGYIIKAAAENSFKIVGGIIDKYYEHKYANIPADMNDNEYDLDDPGAQ